MIEDSMDVADRSHYAATFLADTAAFNRRVAELGLANVDGFYWYHTLDLPHGLVTPGVYDFRTSIDAFQFPDDMRAMHVLDIGSATGFFTFEFERRGAQVVSVELESLYELDRFPGQPIEQTLRQIEEMMAPKDVIAGFAQASSAEQLYMALLEGPYRFCAEQLGSRVRRCYSSIYALTPEKLGRATFDLVFLGDILLHTINPLLALSVAAALCHQTLIVSQALPESADGQPAMLYVGGEDVAHDEVTWWWPNKACLTQLLHKLGFPEVAEIGRNTGRLRPSGHPFDRPILRARR